MTEPEEATLERIAFKSMTPRERIIITILKAAGKRNRKVWGYASGDGGAVPMHNGKIPKTWDRICVEGDETWTRLPLEEKK